MTHPIYSAHARAEASSSAADQLVAQLQGADPAAVVFFYSMNQDGEQIGQQLEQAFPEAVVIGSSSAGEFTGEQTSTDGAVAIALDRRIVEDATGAYFDYDGDVVEAAQHTAEALGDRLGVALRQADPSKYLGIVLNDGLSGREEMVNRGLGNAAPTLNFVGGSAGDALDFERTEVYFDGAVHDTGTVLMLLSMTAPFEVLKTCSFEPVGQRFSITRADEDDRIVWEFDGRPATEAYADAIGADAEELDAGDFMASPVGLMIDDEPWIRSPAQVVDGGGIQFFCSISEGMTVDLMRSTGLVQETRKDVQQIIDSLDKPAGMLAFNCILRRLEIDEHDSHDDFLQAFPVPVTGFHTYGESWLGHINQTLTAVVFGDA